MKLPAGWQRVTITSTASADSKAKMRGLIESAIRSGAPLYNDGNPAACAAVYQVAAEGLLAMGTSLDSTSRSHLEQALRSARSGSDASENAWTLRRALDGVWERVAR